MPFKYNALLGLGLDNTIPLDGAGKIPSTFLPSYVDDVEEYNNLAAFPATGETGKIYVAIDTGFVYRWSGSVYVQIGITAAAGSTTQVQFNDGGAFGGDSGLTFDKTTDALSAGGFIPTSSTVPTNGVYLPAANSVAVATNGTGRLFVDASGNVGVGATATAPFDVFATANSELRLTTASDGYLQIGQFTNGAFIGTSSSDANDGVLRFGTNANERLRITSAGLVGVGVSAPSTILQAAGTVTAGATGVANGAFDIKRSSDGLSVAGLDIDTVNSVARLSTAYSFLSFRTESTEKVRIDSSGRLGIGNTAPSFELDLGIDSAAKNYTQRIITGGSYSAATRYDLNGIGTFTVGFNNSGGVANNAPNGAASIWMQQAYPIVFGTSGSERGRWDSSGRLLVGTSSSSADTRVVIAGTSSGYSGAGLNLANTGSSPADGVALGLINFTDSNHGDAAIVRASRDGGTWTSGSSQPTRLTFSTTADGAASPTERMRITSGGGILCGTTNADHRLTVYESTNGNVIGGRATSASFNATILFAGADRDTTNNSFYYFDCYNYGSSTYRFRIADSGNATNTNNSYGAISDIKLKENIVDANSQWDDLKALQVRNYNFKEATGHQTHTQIGLVAQEVELVSPGLVGESPDRDAEGNDLGTVTKSVNYSVLYMKAVKALQEAMERIEQLEQRLTDAGIA